MKKIYLYNTLTQSKELIQPKSNDKITIYSCGPTIYNYAHIGNFRSYLFADLLIRSLKILNYNPYQVMNLTDVDDKTIKGTIEKYKEPSIENLKKYTTTFENIFFEDIAKLNITSAKEYPKATDHIEAMVHLTQSLLNKNMAYEKDGSIYFSIKDFNEYGQLSKLDADNIKTGSRYNTDEYSKEDIRDFALWKNTNDNKDICWHTSIGKGRPGWHLECSAMIHSIFKGGIDIHTGGVDLIFPHHENEIAQSKAAYGDDFVKYWLHCEHLLVDGKKMSKSLGNFYTLKDLLDKGYHRIYIRYFLLSVHYRQKLNFTLEALEQAGQTVNKIWNTYNRFLDTSLDNINNQIDLDNKLAEFKNQFEESLSDDLNISKALSIFHNFLTFINQILDQSAKKYTKDTLSLSDKNKIHDLFAHFDLILDILKESTYLTEKKIPDNIQIWFNERIIAKQNKNFAESDRLRKLINDSGYDIKDTSTGSVLVYKL